MFAQKFILSVIRNILQLISFPSFASSRPVVARRRLFNLLISFLQLLLQLQLLSLPLRDFIIVVPEPNVTRGEEFILEESEIFSQIAPTSLDCN